jgi:hypothetical protein
VAQVVEMKKTFFFGSRDNGISGVVKTHKRATAASMKSSTTHKTQQTDTQVEKKPRNSAVHLNKKRNLPPRSFAH